MQSKPEDCSDEFTNAMEGRPIYDQDDGERMAARIEALEEMLRGKLDLIKCGIAHNYSGDPYENEKYKEAAELLKPR